MNIPLELITPNIQLIIQGYLWETRLQETHKILIENISWKHQPIRESVYRRPWWNLRHFGHPKYFGFLRWHRHKGFMLRIRQCDTRENKLIIFHSYSPDHPGHTFK